MGTALTLNYRNKNDIELDQWREEVRRGNSESNIMKGKVQEPWACLQCM